MHQKQSPPAAQATELALLHPIQALMGEPLSPILKYQEQQPSVKQCTPGRACLLQTRDRLIFHMPTIFCAVFMQLQLMKIALWNAEQSADLRKWIATKAVSFPRHKMIQDCVRTVNEILSQLQFPFLPRPPHTSPKREAIRRTFTVQRAWPLVSGWPLSLYLPSTLAGAEQAGMPFPFWVSPKDLFLFQSATLGKEEGKSLARAQAETQHSSPREHRLSFPTYPISWWSGPTSSPGARYCGNLCTAFLIELCVPLQQWPRHRALQSLLLKVNWAEIASFSQDQARLTSQSFQAAVGWTSTLQSALLCLPGTSGLQPGPLCWREKKSSHDSNLLWKSQTDNMNSDILSESLHSTRFVF